jgi:glutamine amidotransferase
MITIVDHGMGNLGSVQNMLRRLGADAVLTHDSQQIANSTKLILAGIGAFDTAMARLDELGIVSILNQRVLGDGIPVLGVCLGLQLMTKASEEGHRQGLGWLNAKSRAFAFPSGEELPTPHMGWEVVRPTRASPLLAATDEEQRFYFSHRYHLECHDAGDVAATAVYGYEFPAAIHRDNILGTQFHPEKSHIFGMEVYRRFLALPES